MINCRNSRRSPSAILDFVIFYHTGLSHSSLSMYMPNLRSLAQMVQKLWPIVEIYDGRRLPSWILRFVSTFDHTGRSYSSLYMYTPNFRSLVQMVQKLWPIVEIQDGRQPPSWIFRFCYFDQTSAPTRHCLCVHQI